MSELELIFYSFLNKVLPKNFSNGDLSCIQKNNWSIAVSKNLD